MKRSSINRMLIDEVTIVRAGAVNEYGEPTGATSATVPAKIQNNTTRSVTVAGEDFTSTTQVVTLYDVRVGDVVSIDSSPRLVRAVKKLRGMRGGPTLVEAHL